MRRLLQYTFVVITIGLMTVAGAAHAQGNSGNNGSTTRCDDGDGDNTGCISQFDLPGNGANPNNECAYWGLDPLAKYDFPDDDGSGGGYDPGPDGVSFDTNNPPGVPGDTSGSWTSDTSVGIFLIKQATEIAYWEYDPGVNGESYNSPFNGASHVTLCARDSSDPCGHPTLLFVNDQVDRTDRTVSNTIIDDDGIARFEFTKLENLEVTQTTIANLVALGYMNDDSTGANEWEWRGTTGEEAVQIPFTLRAPNSGTAEYFLVAENTCGGDSKLDPPYDFSIASEASTGLEGSYPNPTRGEATLSFSTAEASPVSLTIYDITGRKVATVVNGVMPAGEHTVTWSGRSDGGSRLASGVYIVRLEAGSYVHTKRLTIIR